MSEGQTKPSRRGFMLGAAAATAATAAVVAVPRKGVEPVAEAEAPPKPERGGGYRLSEHVQHYYRTTRI